MLFLLRIVLIAILLSTCVGYIDSGS